MNWFWMNIPAALVFLGLWSGIPMWLILRHPDRGPAQVPAPTPAQVPAQARQAAPVGPQIADAAQRADQLAGVG